MMTHALRRTAEDSQIMGMPAPHAITTIEELLALPEDGLRHELLDGEHVVTPAPSPPHQWVVSRIWSALTHAAGDRDDLAVLTSPADIHLGPRSVVQPDLFVVKQDPSQSFYTTWKSVPIPLVAVEVLSPSTARRDRGKKRRLYLEAGVEEYWIVDIDARLVERWRSGDDRPEVVDAELHWALSVGASGSLDVPSLFERLGL